MNYFYNIIVNLQTELLNFYEWDKNDRLLTLRKVKAYKVSDKIYDYILSKSIKFDNSFLSILENRVCIFYNEIDAVCVQLCKNGYISKLSKLDLDDEREIISLYNPKDEFNFRYELTNDKIINNYLTREESKRRNLIITYLTNEKNNVDLIDYIYYIFFGKQSGKNKYNSLIESINKEYTEKNDQIFELINNIECINK